MTTRCGYTCLEAHTSEEVPVTIRGLLTRRWVAAAVIAVLALVTFALPAWCIASGTWTW